MLCYKNGTKTEDGIPTIKRWNPPQNRRKDKEEKVERILGGKYQGRIGLSCSSAKERYSFCEYHQ